MPFTTPPEFPSVPFSEVSISFQLVANSVVAAAVNVAGVWLHQMMEAAQRKAFLDTRNCIAARLHMEDENDKLVSTKRAVSCLLCSSALVGARWGGPCHARGPFALGIVNGI